MDPPIPLIILSGPPVPPKRIREKYSRLICIGCRDRRIRCELPSDVEIPKPGELRTIQTPCHRCKRLGIPCVIRQTILGRPGHSSRSAASINAQLRHKEVPVAGPPAEAQPSPVQDKSASGDSSVVKRPRLGSPGLLTSWNGVTPLVHAPQSPERVFIMHAMDTLRYECVEEEWFRHLPAYVGHSLALDLSIRAIVAACALARGRFRVTSRDCYEALSLALRAVQATIEQSNGEPNDDMLAATALLAPFEGVVQRNGIPTRLHVDGIATILAARPVTFPVTQLARDILDFNAGECAVMACIQDTPSPFEGVPRAYYANEGVGYSDSDRGRLKALSNEMFIHIPRLVNLVRSLRLQSPPKDEVVLETQELLDRLLKLQDSQSEERLLRSVAVRHSPTSSLQTLHPKLHFASYKDFEALSYYWQSRLSVLRLDLHFRALFAPAPGQALANEMVRLAQHNLWCSKYAATLRLNKHIRLFTHAMVAVWGVTMDLRVNLSQNHEYTSEFLLRKVNDAISAEPDLTVEDMNTAAEVFVGGQPTGRFVELYVYRSVNRPA